MEKKSIFIIGAGSSKEYDYPIWKELKPQIENHLKDALDNGDPASIKAIEWLGEITDEKTLDEVISDKNKAIRQKPDPSEVEAVIWKAIASIFSALEKPILNGSKIGWIDKFSNSILNSILAKYDSKDKDWDKKIMAELNAQLGNMYFITFNYDRILEYKIITQITEALRNDVSNNNFFDQLLAPAIEKFFFDKFYHPHGIINPYANVRDNSKVDFKNRNNSNIAYFGDVKEHHLQFSPGLMASCFDCNEDSGSFGDLKKVNSSPKQIFILGNSTYGLQNNLKKLPCAAWAASIDRIVCTSFNDADQDSYRKIIYEAFGKSIVIDFYKTCDDFINDSI